MRPYLHEEGGATPDPNKRAERPIEQRGAAELITTVATVVAATPAAIQVGGQIKDKLTKK